MKTCAPFKLVTFLGIRPDIIRMHKLLRLLDAGQKRYGYEHIFVHSGQHFDYELDGVFYRQLRVRQPDWNLRVGRSLKKRGETNYVHQAALLIERTAVMLGRLRPDAVLYLGDTNTVLSSLIVARSNVPVIHIEGGGRSYDWRMPEEKNRITIDHLSDLVYCYLERYKEILLTEGIPQQRIVVVGNIILDALEAFLPEADKNPIVRQLGLKSREYALCTLHREENVESREVLAEKISGLATFSKELPVALPLMPRVQGRIRKYGLATLLRKSNILCPPPLGFLEFLKLEKDARLIITDSGTVQEEALILGVPCLVTRRSTERPETIAAGATILSDNGLHENALRALAMNTGWDRTILNPQGGSPSKRIYEDLMARIRSGFFASNRRLEALSCSRFVREAYGHDLAHLGAAIARGGAETEA